MGTESAIPAASTVFIPSVRVRPAEAAAIAAMNRAAAVQNAPPATSNLDPSASIEPVTMVVHKPPVQVW